MDLVRTAQSSGGRLETGPQVSRFAPKPASRGDLPHSETEKIRDAAREFESLLIEQMLRSARAAGSGEWMGEDQTASPLSEMAEQQFARALSAGGGLGLAKLVVEGLERKPPEMVQDAN